MICAPFVTLCSAIIIFETTLLLVTVDINQNVMLIPNYE